MKLLLCVSSVSDIDSALQELSYSPTSHSFFKFLSSSVILHHEVDILETGVGIYQTAYKITKVLSRQKYHLALKLGFGNSYNENLGAGSVLNIINEKPGDFGMRAEQEWKDHYDLNLINRDAEPH